MIVETTSGHVIVADDTDAELLSGYRWFARRGSTGDLYAEAHVPGTRDRVYMHRLLMEPPDGMIVHHKNNNGLDNRRLNLLVTTQRVNIWFAHLKAEGVNRHRGRWRAQVRDETGKRVSLGVHDTKEEAKARVQNWRYFKMLELEQRGDQESAHLAEALHGVFP